MRRQPGEAVDVQGSRRRRPCKCRRQPPADHDRPELVAACNVAAARAEGRGEAVLLRSRGVAAPLPGGRRAAHGRCDRRRSGPRSRQRRADALPDAGARPSDRGRRPPQPELPDPAFHDSVLAAGRPGRPVRAAHDVRRRDLEQLPDPLLRLALPGPSDLRARPAALARRVAEVRGDVQRATQGGVHGGEERRRLLRADPQRRAELARQLAGRAPRLPRPDLPDPPHG